MTAGGAARHFLDSAFEILDAAGQPIHYRVLAQRLAQDGVYVPGQDPAANLLTQMTRDAVRTSWESWALRPRGMAEPARGNGGGSCAQGQAASARRSRKRSTRRLANVDSPVRVTSIDDEDRLLGACSCGRPWCLLAEDVAPIRGRWFDALVVGCPDCGGRVRAIFDVTAFFEPQTSAWARALA